MPPGEFEAHVEQLPRMIEILSGGNVKVKLSDDEG